jgi:UDP-N-acetylmuramoyl-L-alanyl-D-glutamate--2,6-diaminopimelate ligase
MRLFTLLKALDTLQTNAPSLDCEVGGVHNDTRVMEPGDMFVAIAGTEQDGFGYIGKAIEAGASMIVTERPLDPEVPHVVVPDARAALARLAACMHGYPAEKLIMTGVTGTKGKTTVTHLIKGLIEGVTGEKAGLIGTIHTERTTPDAVQLNKLFAGMLDEGCKHCVMEVSSHALDQKRVAGITYKAGAFTNLHRDHLDYHKDMEDYFLAKARLFSQSQEVILNTDDPYGARLHRQYPNARTVSREKMENLSLCEDGISFGGISWGTPGLFSAYNALTAVTVGEALGLPAGEMKRVFPSIPPVKGRMEPVAPGVIIDYAHTPDAIQAALKTARAFTKGRLIALFGCGGDRDHGKRPLMGKAARENADICFITSDNPRTEDPEAIIGEIIDGLDMERVTVEPDRRKAIGLALREAKPGDTVMLLGKGHEVTQEIGKDKLPFDEREIIKEWINS